MVEMGVMPQQRKVPPKAVAGIAIALHQRQGLIAVTQAQVALGDDGAFHDDQRALAQAQGAALVQVIERILATGAAAKAGAVGEAQGAVIVQALVVPQAGGGGRLPAQKVLAAAELRLVDAFLGQHPAQGGDRAGQGLGVAVSVVAGVDADLVATGVDLAQQSAQARVVQADPVVEPRVGVLRDAVKGHRAAGPFVDVHDVRQTGPVRVQAVIAPARAPLAAQVAPGQAGGAAFEQVAGEAAGQAVAGLCSGFATDDHGWTRRLRRLAGPHAR